MARNRYTPETIIRKLREAEILRGQVVQALMTALGIVVIDERTDPRLQVTG